MVSMEEIANHKKTWPRLVRLPPASIGDGSYSSPFNTVRTSLDRSSLEQASIVNKHAYTPEN